MKYRRASSEDSILVITISCEGQQLTFFPREDPRSGRRTLRIHLAERQTRAPAHTPYTIGNSNIVYDSDADAAAFGGDER